MTTNIVMEMGYAADLHREALIATGVVLFVFILIINLCVSALKRKAESEEGGARNGENEKKYRQQVRKMAAKM